MNQISPERIVDITASCCRKEELSIPRGLRADFLDNVIGVGSIDQLSIKSIRELTYKICKKIETILDTDRKLAKKYRKLFAAVRADVRWHIILELEKLSDVLGEFLAGLPAGKSWNIADLRHWKQDGKNRGERLFSLVRREKGQFTIDEIKAVLGRKRGLLKRNPFEKVEHNERNIAWAKRVLIKFLTTLKSGRSWDQSKLRRWKGDGSENGENLCQWIHQQKQGFQYETVAQILGDDADRLLDGKRFNRRDEIIWNTQRAGQTLRWYFSTLQDGEHWNSTSLRKFQEPGGIAIGQRLYAWIKSTKGVFNLKVVKEILGAEAKEYLLRNPYEKEEQIGWTPLKAKRLLKEYLETLEEGETWGRNTLFLWKKDDLNMGERLYKWILGEWMATEESGFTLEKIEKLLGVDAETLLARNPFKKQEQKLWNLTRARGALKRYLASLQEGQAWNVIQLISWRGKGTNNGPNLYRWIWEKKGEMNETVVRWILGKESNELLVRNPFVKGVVQAQTQG